MNLFKEGRRKKKRERKKILGENIKKEKKIKSWLGENWLVARGKNRNFNKILLCFIFGDL